jgi:hypothetical protein
MSAHDRDDLLRDAFARLRREVEPRVPDAARLLARRPAAGRATQGRLVFSAALGVALTLLLVTIRGERATPPGAGGEPVTRAVALDGYPWRGPTDFLLDLPGAELARTTPSFDATSTLLPAIDLLSPERAEVHRGGRGTR